MEKTNGDAAADVGAESGHLKVAPLALVAAAFRGGRFGVRSDPVGPLLLTKPYRPTIRTIALFTRTLGPNRLRGHHYRSPRSRPLQGAAEAEGVGVFAEGGDAEGDVFVEGDS